MKRTLLLICFLLTITGLCYSQGIQFEKSSFEAALAKAKETDKLLFVDVYTSWCGPCKRMARETFTQNRVGKYFNEHFINYQQDGEKGNGPEIMKKYNIRAFPTFLFLDGNSNLIFRLTGFHDAKEFIAAISNLDFYIKYGGQEKVDSYKSGSGSTAFFADYYSIATAEESPEILNRYLSSMPDEQLLSSATAPLVMQMSLYNKDLLIRIAQGITKIINRDIEFLSTYEYPFRNKIGNLLTESIREGNEQKFREMLEIKSLLTKENSSDINVTLNSGLSDASSDLLYLWYNSQNKCNSEKFKQSIEKYMSLLINTNPIDTLLKSCQKLKYSIDHPDTSYIGKLIYQNIDLSENLAWAFRPISNFIVDWTNYYWKISPSDKATRKRCLIWLQYACSLNPYNPETVIKATPLLVRLKHPGEARNFLEKAISAQQDLGSKYPKDLQNLRETLQDLVNKKI